MTVGLCGPANLFFYLVHGSPDSKKLYLPTTRHHAEARDFEADETLGGLPQGAITFDICVAKRLNQIFGDQKGTLWWALKLFTNIHFSSASGHSEKLHLLASPKLHVDM